MAQVSKKIVNKDKAQDQLPIIQAGQPIQTIYADRILNVGFGPVVSKLTLGMEVGPSTFAPYANLVIPTIALVEAVEFIQKAMGENEQMNTAILEGLDKLRAHLDKKNK